MSIFGKLIGAGIRTVLLPVEVAKDVVTLGGSINDEEEPYTLQQLKNIGKDIKDAVEEAEEL